MKAVIFDLDDTLYPEAEFVQSGFRAVAEFISGRFRLNGADVITRLDAVLSRQGRGKVFDTVLEELGLFGQERVKLLLHIYRSHRPQIHLYEGVTATLVELRNRGIRLGILTDGMASVQRRKIDALGLYELVESIVCTDELGPECWKPSPVAYRIVLDLLGVEPVHAVYVGNDPTKDFAGARAIGMATIQVTWGQASPIAGAAKIRPAQFVIGRFDELLAIMERLRPYDCDDHH